METPFYRNTNAFRRMGRFFDDLERKSFARIKVFDLKLWHLTNKGGQRFEWVCLEKPSKTIVLGKNSQEMEFDQMNQINMDDLLNGHTVWTRKSWLLKLLDQQIQWARFAHSSTSGFQFEPEAWANLKSRLFERNRPINRKQSVYFVEPYWWICLGWRFEFWISKNQIGIL